MGLMFAWATKEYLLWKMSLGQIITYYNIGMDIKYSKGTKTGRPKKLSEMSVEEVKAFKEECRRKYGDIGN